MILRNVNFYQTARRHIPVVTNPHSHMGMLNLTLFLYINQDKKNKTLHLLAVAPPSVNVPCRYRYLYTHIFTQKHNYEPVLLGALTCKGSVLSTGTNLMTIT
jgi:hypothetical protein